MWKPNLCTHSANCVNGLPGVFDVKKKPWINAEGASSEHIEAQIKKCPLVGGGFQTAVPHTPPVSKLAKSRLRREILIVGPPKIK